MHRRKNNPQSNTIGRSGDSVVNSRRSRDKEPFSSPSLSSIDEVEERKAHRKGSANFGQQARQKLQEDKSSVSEEQFHHNEQVRSV
jgi:hypothetical protein